MVVLNASNRLHALWTRLKRSFFLMHWIFSWNFELWWKQHCLQHALNNPWTAITGLLLPIVGSHGGSGWAGVGAVRIKRWVLADGCIRNLILKFVSVPIRSKACGFQVQTSPTAIHSFSHASCGRAQCPFCTAPARLFCVSISHYIFSKNSVWWLSALLALRISESERQAMFMLAHVPQLPLHKTQSNTFLNIMMASFLVTVLLSSLPAAWVTPYHDEHEDMNVDEILLLQSFRSLLLRVGGHP